MKIYGYLTFNVTKVLLAAVHAKIPFEYELVDLAKRANYEPAFCEINPYKKVPALEDGGLKLWESGAICRYIARKTGDESLYPSEPAAAARVDQWLELSSCHVTKFCGTMFFETFLAPKFFDKPTNEARVEEAKKDCDVAAKVLDDQLAEGDYLTGSNVTIGDYALFAPLHDAVKIAGYDLSRFSHLNRWFQAIEGSDVAKVVYGEYQKFG